MSTDSTNVSPERCVRGGAGGTTRDNWRTGLLASAVVSPEWRVRGGGQGPPSRQVGGWAIGLVWVWVELTKAGCCVIVIVVSLFPNLLQSLVLSSFKWYHCLHFEHCKELYTAVVYCCPSS